MILLHMRLMGAEKPAMQYMHAWDENGAGTWHAQGKLGYRRLAGSSSPSDSPSESLMVAETKKTVKACNGQNV